MADVQQRAAYGAVPAMSAHRSLTLQERVRSGSSDNLVRLSLGIEEGGDIVADLDQALAAALGGSAPTDYSLLGCVGTLESILHH